MISPFEFGSKRAYNEPSDNVMTWASELKVGDVIVDAGSVCEVFKIEKDLIFFRPYFQINSSPIICSIPAENMGKTKIRKVVTKKRLGEIMQELVVGLEDDFEVDIEIAKTAVGENQPIEIARMINKLWGEQQDEEISFSKSRRTTLELMLDTLAEEVAYLYGCKLEEGRNKITSKLKRASK